MANINETIGAVLVGALVSALLSGTVTIQTLVYFKLYGRDDYRWNTFIVGIIWFLDSVHISMISASTWFYLVQNWGNATIHDFIPWTLALTPALTAIVTLISHCFFAHRIFVLSGSSWLLTGPTILLAIGRLAAALTATSKMLILRSYKAFVEQVAWVCSVGLALSTAVDVLIAISLIILLQRSRTGFSTITDHLIDVVTLYTIETGLVTSITTSVSLVCWLTMPHNLIFFALHFAISKLYATSTLTTLNARKSLRRRTRQPDQHILPIISSLHDVSQTHHGDDPTSKVESPVSPARITSMTRSDTKQGDMEGNEGDGDSEQSERTQQSSFPYLLV